MQQQPLALTFEQTKHLVVGNANLLAYQYLLERNQWLNHVCWLAGDQGSGKTMLANEWRAKFGAVDIDLFNHDFANLQVHYYLIDDLPSFDCLHEPLFHLINAIKAAGAKLLLCSNLTPAQYPTNLADLSSRLKAADFVEISAPDDAMLKAVMQAHLAAKQLKVEEQVLDYLIKRINRSCGQAVAVLNELDAYSLKHNAEITINMVKNALSI
jgi:chromosomal replication initiation ATPase DnaA